MDRPPTIERVWKSNSSSNREPTVLYFSACYRQTKMTSPRDERRLRRTKQKSSSSSTLRSSFNSQSSSTPSTASQPPAPGSRPFHCLPQDFAVLPPPPGPPPFSRGRQKRGANEDSRGRSISAARAKSKGNASSARAARENDRSRSLSAARVKSRNNAEDRERFSDRMCEAKSSSTTHRHNRKGRSRSKSRHKPTKDRESLVEETTKTSKSRGRSSRRSRSKKDSATDSRAPKLAVQKSTAKDSSRKFIVEIDSQGNVAQVFEFSEDGVPVSKDDVPAFAERGVGKVDGGSQRKCSSEGDAASPGSSNTSYHSKSGSGASDDSSAFHISDASFGSNSNSGRDHRIPDQSPTSNRAARNTEGVLRSSSGSIRNSSTHLESTSDHDKATCTSDGSAAPRMYKSSSSKSLRPSIRSTQRNSLRVSFALDESERSGGEASISRSVSFNLGQPNEQQLKAPSEPSSATTSLDESAVTFQDAFEQKIGASEPMSKESAEQRFSGHSVSFLDDGALKQLPRADLSSRGRSSRQGKRSSRHSRSLSSSRIAADVVINDESSLTADAASARGRSASSSRQNRTRSLSRPRGAYNIKTSIDFDPRSSLRSYASDTSDDVLQLQAFPQKRSLSVNKQSYSTEETFVSELTADVDEYDFYPFVEDVVDTHPDFLNSTLTIIDSENSEEDQSLLSDSPSLKNQWPSSCQVSPSDTGNSQGNEDKPPIETPKVARKSKVRMILSKYRKNNKTFPASPHEESFGSSKETMTTEDSSHILSDAEVSLKIQHVAGDGKRQTAGGSNSRVRRFFQG